MFLTYLCTTLLLLTGFLLMFIVLLQRGRGGGLAGAFGGLGGQSAFGTKAGDVFTKITIVLAVIWVSLAGVTGFAMRYESGKTAFKGEANIEPEVTAPEKTAGAGKTLKKPVFPKRRTGEDEKTEKTKLPPKTSKTSEPGSGKTKAGS